MIQVHGGDVYSNQNIEMDFSVNVNPLGIPERVREAAEKSLRDCSRYPDSSCGALREAAAACYRVKKEQLIFGNGAADLIFRVVRALRPKRAVVFAPSFGEYEAALLSVGAQCRFFYLKEDNGFEIPVDEYLAFLKETEPSMIFLCNPANPTGTVFSEEEMEKILDYCEDKGIFALVDECFLEFLPDGESRSALSHVRRGKKNVFVLNALTKTFCLAGLRMGFGFLADEELMERLSRENAPWSVSIPAQAAGLCVFSNPEFRREYLTRTWEFVEREKKKLWEGLERAGFSVWGSQVNFLFFKDNTQGADASFYEYFLKKGVLIRSCESYRGLSEKYYRICVNKQEYNEKFLMNLLDYL